MKTNLSHPMEDETNNPLNLFRKEHIGHTCMTEHGVGKCKTVELNGWCKIDVAGLGDRDCRIEEIIW